jgi:hypothetical protein
MMKTKTIVQYSLVLCLIGLTSTQALAFGGFGDDWNEFYPDACQELKDATTFATNCALCHTAGFGLNAYGVDVGEANNDFLSIEDLDSDGDGRTNGEEINLDCSLPGDAVSPTDADTWGGIKVLFR